jgi:uncharacterized protein (TIGR02246 family)
MKNLFLFIICVLISGIAIGQTPQMARDAENIQKLLNDFSQAWNVHDAKALSMSFAEDADFTNVRGSSAHGRTDIEKFHTPSFAGIFKNSNLKMTDKKIRFITNDITAVDAWWEMKGATLPDGKEIPLRKGLANLILTRGDDKWFIMVMHNMDLPVTQ